MTAVQTAVVLEMLARAAYLTIGSIGTRERSGKRFGTGTASGSTEPMLIRSGRKQK